MNKKQFCDLLDDRVVQNKLYEVLIKLKKREDLNNQIREDASL